MDNQMSGKQEVSVEILCESVLQDAVLAEIDMHHSLLQKLAQSGDYYDDLNQDNDTPFLSSLGMNHLVEMSVSSSSLLMNEDLSFVPETHSSLLQQAAWDREHFDYEMRKSIAKIVLEDELFDVGSSVHSVDSCMQFRDQICMSKLLIDSYRLELKYKIAYISMCQWDPGILSLGDWPIGGNFSPWKSDLIRYCYEKMSPWNLTVFNPRDGMQQQLRPRFNLTG
jgi:hypothetical protein